MYESYGSATEFARIRESTCPPQTSDETRWLEPRVLRGDLDSGVRRKYSDGGCGTNERLAATGEEPIELLFRCRYDAGEYVAKAGEGFELESLAGGDQVDESRRDFAVLYCHRRVITIGAERERNAKNITGLTSILLLVRSIAIIPGMVAPNSGDYPGRLHDTRWIIWPLVRCHALRARCKRHHRPPQLSAPCYQA